MKKNCKRTVLAVLLILLVSSFCITVYATENEETIDYEALFAREDEVDGHLAEAYYLEVSSIFDDAPAEFVQALSKQSYSKIISLSNAIVIEHSSNFSAYEKQLDDLKLTVDKENPIYETLFLMKLSILRFYANRHVDPYAFERDNHEAVRNYYSENRHLFLLSVASMNEYAVEDFTDALVYELDTDELKSLDVQLVTDMSSDWITDDIEDTITTIRNRINELVNPTPPAKVPDETEPTPPPTSSATVPTHPTEPAPIAPPQEKTNDLALIVTVVVSVALISCIVAYLFYKKRSK